MIKTPLSTVIGGVGFYTKNAVVIGSGHKSEPDPPFDIASVFSNGKQGFWLDPSDLSTMFQDATGTIPVTGAGQPVGLMLDKSKGLLIGNEIISDVELNNSTYWTTTSNVAVSNGVATFTNATTARALISPNGITSLNQWYEVEIFVDSITSGQISIAETGSPISSVLSVGLNRVKILANGSAGRSLRIYALGTTNAVVSKFSAKPITGNHAYQTTSASRPILRQNATTGAYYLEFDGSDDFLQTSNIDFTATDKVSLFTGLRKLRDSPAESILELGVLPYDGVGTFWLTTNALAPGDVWLAIAQAWNARTGFSKVTPVANNFIFSAKLDFAGSVATDEVKPRLNGSTAGFTRGLGEHAGTGNFGNHPMYIGSRTGTSLQFNGHLYSLIGVGRLTTDNETTALEQELAKRTGVTLS